MSSCRRRCHQVAKGESGTNDGQRELGALSVKRLDVRDRGWNDRAVGGLHNLERHVVSPVGPVFAEALGLILGCADVQRQHRLTQRYGVRERVHCHPVQIGDRNDGEVGELRWGLLALVARAGVGTQAGRVGDVVEVAPVSEALRR